MDKRRAITDKMKLKVLRDHGASVTCRVCRAIVFITDIEFDHVRALVDDGRHETENLRPICGKCHALKSAFEHKRNSKMKRIARGGKTVRRPMKKHPTLKKTVGGKVVERRT